MVTIRQATAEDSARVVEMVCRFIAETPYAAVVTTAADKLLETTLAVMTSAGVIFVAERHSSVIGFIAVAAIREPPLGGEPFAEELAWWVEPEARGGRTAVYLLGAAENWTLQNRLSCLKMVAPHGSRVGTFYQRRGYEPIETAFIKRLTNGSILDAGARAPTRSSGRRDSSISRGEEEGEEPRSGA